jgi:hypothetical protein
MTALSSCCHLQPAMTPKRLRHNSRCSVIRLRNFRMPDALRGLWLVHVKVMTELLFATVRGTLYELLGDAKYLGAQPGQEPMVLDWQTAYRERGDAHPERCPRCGRLLVRLGGSCPLGSHHRHMCPRRWWQEPPAPVSAWRPWEGCALAPRQMGCWATPARPMVRESFSFRPRYQLAASLSLPRRVGSGLSGSYKFHSQGVHNPVRGSSNPVLKRPAANAGGWSGRWSRGRLTPNR